jgi:hypothetical protein
VVSSANIRDLFAAVRTKLSLTLSKVCCHTGSDENGGDLCGSGSTYGLCGVTGTQLWRESCTDPTWESPACLKLCTTGAGTYDGHIYVFVTSNADEKQVR